MTTPEPLTLAGCAPTPLAAYLKALGVLRLVSSDASHAGGRAADPAARGWWQDECFRLAIHLDREALLRFFLEDYAPSPVVAPWNGGSGFFPKDKKDGIDRLQGVKLALRFEPIAETVRRAANILKKRGLGESPKGDAKTALVAALRAELPDAALEWLDAALALSSKTLAYPPLLGTGGNDGRLDFTNNFMQRLVAAEQGLFDAVSGAPTPEARPLLENALFAKPSQGLRASAVGQFAPGAAGGPNATAGYEGEARVNPWDFVLMLEGAAAFAGAATRRHEGAASAGASFPFTVRPVGAGWGGVEAADEKDARAEFWAPLWSRPAGFGEIRSLLAEGRAVLNGRTARDGLEFARAVASLGVSRGIAQFERYGFLMRSGKAFLAAPLGRRDARPARAARLIVDLDAGGWLERARRVGRDENGPAAVRNAVRRLEDSLFALADPVEGAVRDKAQAALSALGALGLWLAVTPKGREAVGRPPPALSPDWIWEADDRSPEFRVAEALAGLGLPGARQDGAAEAPPALPMAAHLAPIGERGFPACRAWADADSRTAVWSGGGLVVNMLAVLERRLVETAVRGLGDKPLVGAAHAHLADVAAFLSGEFNDARCAALLAGLVWARPRSPWPDRADDAVPFAWAALKPVFSADAALRRVDALDEGARLPVPPGLVQRLRAAGGACDGRAADDAVRVALARARASGLPSPFAGSHGSRFGVGVRADRLAAALLIPVGDAALKSLLDRVYADDPDDDLTEDARDAA